MRRIVKLINHGSIRPQRKGLYINKGKKVYINSNK